MGTAAKDDKDGNIKGYRLKTVNFWILALGFVLVLALMGINKRIGRDFDAMLAEEENYRKSENSIFELQQTSDDLTELARNYVNSQRRKFLEEYFALLEESGGRRSIAADFKKRYGTKDRKICDILTAAVKGSEELAQRNILALKMMADGLGEDIQSLPQELRSYDLPVGSQMLAPEQKLQRASDILFGTDYVMREQRVKTQYNKVWQWAEKQAKQSQDEGSVRMGKILRVERGLIYVLIVMIAGLFVFLFRWVLAPLNNIITQLKAQQPVEVKGFYEMQYLADTYNDICRINAASKLELNQQANYDALTGIMNRGSFNRMCEFLRGSLQPLVFMLIDVDVFKSINDNYGHDVGDQALIKMAGVLKSSFRDVDYTVRYGGDEFAVLMVGGRPTDKPVIAEKVNRMNEVLGHPGEDEGVPPFSISVGVAFSPKGYSEELFRKADKAVYHTKSHGRCGYTFYQDHNMVKVDSPVTK